MCALSFSRLMKIPTITPAATVAEILAYSPQIVRLFVEKHIDCAGCSMAPFCTVEEICKSYNLVVRDFIDEIQAALLIDTPSQPQVL
ncbi:MAG: hypothetical protein NTW32_20775 [Chloroflexi bacterium]|nr:hypothetical protein [Chloroflexota bacterium]